ncbi:MAG: CHAT domain-containing protein [Myxococcota bacterium]
MRQARDGCTHAARWIEAPLVSFAPRTWPVRLARSARLAALASILLLLASGSVARSEEGRGAADGAADRMAGGATPAAQHAALVERAEQALAGGAIREARDALDEAFSLARTLGDPVRLGLTRSLRGRLFAATGELEQARAELEAAQPLLEASPPLAAANRLDAANLAARTGRLDTALAAYQAVAGEARSRGDRGMEARALANALRARIEADPAALGGRAGGRAAKDGIRALDGLEGAEQAPLRASLALHLARSLELARASAPGRTPDWTRAANALLTRALADADAARSTALRAEALASLGALYEAEGHFEEALGLTDRALAQARRSETAGIGARATIQAGRLRRRLGDLDGALARYEEAVAIVGRPREAVGSPPAGRGGRSVFESEDAEAYRGLVDLLLRRAARQTEPASRTADLRAAQAVLERYRVAELRDYFADDCVDRNRASRARVDEAPGNFLVLYPVILDDRLELLVSRRGEIESRTVAIGRVELEKLARQYRGLLEDRTTRLYLRPAQALERVLIEPIRDLLERDAPDTLVVVPDGILRTIPFAALHDGERHLIERIALATTPSLELSDPHPFDRTKVGSLYGGLTTAVQGFDALPQVKQELETANKYLPGKVLLDESFSREALIENLSTRSFDLVHVASHAEFSSADRGGFLLTHDGKLRLDEFRRAVELLQYRERPLELLVLSACETAAGDERAALGFSGAAVQAGARSVLGSLWLVQDEATSALLATFYEALADPSVSRAQAMQRAQRRLIDDPAYAHPSSWAAFLLINSWL